ncbi:MAG: FAD-dependent monooxygenase [Rhodobiaceae bacterium]|nr:FAD-dependent monooxygenase [Rhodobiaceae bacterium]
MADNETFDFVISGGGFVGRVLALALADADAGRIAIVDRRPEGAPEPGDQRSSALAAAVIRMLDTLDLWPFIEADAQPISAMEVTDSALADPIRPVFLTFDTTLPDGEPFAHMVPNRAFSSALSAAIEDQDITVFQGDSIAAIDFADPAALTLESSKRLSARLVIAADGARSTVRQLAGIKTVGWDYDQMGLVTELAHETPHDGRAEEHFLPTGPFAILPLKGNRSSLVWTERTAAARRLLALSREDLQEELLRRVPPHYGALSIEGPVEGYPLKLKLARDYIAPRLALAGDAAHVVHPLAGQGLNLGLRDVAALAEVLVDAVRLGLDPGSMATLQDYQRWRRFDVVQMAVVTDGLNRLFGVDLAPVRMIRDFGMGVVDRLPGLKKALIGEAAGTGGAVPRLLRGEVI